MSTGLAIAVSPCFGGGGMAATAGIVAPVAASVIRWGETVNVDVQVSGPIASVAVTVGVAAPAAAADQGGGLWRYSFVVADTMYGSLAISAAATRSDSGLVLSAGSVTVEAKLDLPLASTGRTIPAAGDVVTWGDLGVSSGTPVSSGSVVRFGAAPSSGAYRITPTAPLEPGHTIVALIATGASTIVSGGRASTTTTPGCGIILDLTSTSGGRAQTQVFSNTGAYVGAVYAPLTNPHGFHLLASNRDPATGTTRIYIDGVLAASSVIATTQSAVSTPFYIAGIGGDLYRFAGVWNRQLSAIDLAQLQSELAAEIVDAPIAQTGAVPAAGSVATWGSYGTAAEANRPTSDGSAVVFDGTNDYVTYNNATTGFSGRITAAVRWSSAAATWDDYPTFGVRGAHGWLIQGVDGGKSVKCFVANAAGTFIEMHEHTFDDITVPHTISFSWDHQAASGIVVVDGALVDTHAQALSRDNTGAATHELGYDSTSSRYLNGSVYDARLYLGVTKTLAQHQALHTEMAS